MLRDLDGNGNTIADYLNGPGIDSRLRQTSAGTALYFIQDHLGTTRALADAGGAVTSSISYDSYGGITSGSTPTRYTYTGREFDSDTGLMYYRARWYDAHQGRFLSEDPIEFEGGSLNFYTYVDNDPINANDPLGLQGGIPRVGRPQPPVPQPPPTPTPKPIEEDACSCDKRWDMRLADMREIVEPIGWGLRDNGKPYLKKAIPWLDVNKKLTEMDFKTFINWNPRHFGGTDWEGQIDGRWYHLNVQYPIGNPNPQPGGGVPTELTSTVSSITSGQVLSDIFLDSSDSDVSAKGRTLDEVFSTTYHDAGNDNGISCV
ncbi:MAG: RHS repeat-associated core domain-containing protein [Acidobacteriota bacterium]